MADDEGKTETTGVPETTVRDTGPLSSKKFLALMFAMATNKALLLTGLLVLRNDVAASSAGLWWWMDTLTVVDGFLSVGGILGIAYVDKYVRVAQLALQAPKKP
jgi:hypothetical protein